MADKPKHTPGPWRWRNGSLEPVEPTEHLAAILDEDGARLVANYTAAASAELEADHRLIAAAPDLLAALQAMTAYHDELGAKPADQRLLDAAYAAIAKATGA